MELSWILFFCKLVTHLIFMWLTGGSCQRIWYTSAVSAFLDLGKATKPHLSSQSAIVTTGGSTDCKYFIFHFFLAIIYSFLILKIDAVCFRLRLMGALWIPECVMPSLHCLTWNFFEESSLLKKRWNGNCFLQSCKLDFVESFRGLIFLNWVGWSVDLTNLLWA